MSIPQFFPEGSIPLPRGAFAEPIGIIAAIRRKNMSALRARIQTGCSLRGHQFSEFLFFRNLNRRRRQNLEQQSEWTSMRASASQDMFFLYVENTCLPLLCHMTPQALSSRAKRGIFGHKAVSSLRSLASLGMTALSLHTMNPGSGLSGLGRKHTFFRTVSSQSIQAATPLVSPLSTWPLPARVERRITGAVLASARK
uniref:Uncharacterized protein n=1 Tax=Candidatus Kentrum sp. TC TaxID=2126339 RepID=A0A450YTJ6_9GAMM|nr:MAG: hypothetical protein BECKTC1821E_GA0114239_10418 [Candidatus Kentron sp. TC]